MALLTSLTGIVQKGDFIVNQNWMMVTCKLGQAFPVPSSEILVTDDTATIETKTTDTKVGTDGYLTVKDTYIVGIKAERPHSTLSLAKSHLKTRYLAT